MTLGLGATQAQEPQALPDGFWNAAASSIASEIADFCAQHNTDAPPDAEVALCHNDSMATMTVTVSTTNGALSVRRFIVRATGQVLSPRELLD
jgi:hypothetical protein